MPVPPLFQNNLGKLVLECQTILVFAAASGDGRNGGDTWNSETSANHLHILPVKSLPAAYKYSIFVARCPSSHQTYSVKALKPHACIFNYISSYKKNQKLSYHSNMQIYVKNSHICIIFIQLWLYKPFDTKHYSIFASDTYYSATQTTHNIIIIVTIVIIAYYLW